MEELARGEWLALRVEDGWYEYASELGGTGDLVVVLGFKKDPGEPFQLLGRFETVPCHDGKLKLVSLTGKAESTDWKTEAHRELVEESGVKGVEPGQLHDVGIVYPSKAMDTIAHLFVVDLTGHELGEAKGDGTKGEEGTYCEWVPLEDMVDCKDPLVHVLMLRAWPLIF